MHCFNLLWQWLECLRLLQGLTILNGNCRSARYYCSVSEAYYAKTQIEGNFEAGEYACLLLKKISPVCLRVWNGKRGCWGEAGEMGRAGERRGGGHQPASVGPNLFPSDAFKSGLLSGKSA